MMRTRSLQAAAATITAMLAAACLSGCLGQADAPPIRYFQPPPIEDPGADGVLAGASAGERPLLVRVGAAPYIDEPVVWRDDGVELGFYPDRRWVALPERFLEDALIHELHGRRGYARAAGVRATVVEVELLAFEETRRPVHAALVRVRAVRKDPSSDALPTVERTARVPLDDDEPETLARAMGEALTVVAADIGAWLDASR